MDVIKSAIITEAEDTTFTLQFRYNAVLIDAIKQRTASRAWDPDAKHWVISKRELGRTLGILKDHNYVIYDGDPIKEQEDEEEWERMRNQPPPPPPPYPNLFSRGRHPQPPTHYTTLNLMPGAPKRQVEASYKALAMTYHPDVNKTPQANDKMKSINIAFAAIKKENGWT